MAASGKIIDLRKLLAERFPHPLATAATHLVTGLSFLDESSGGGLPRRAITELISPARSATTPATSSRSDAGRAHTIAGGPRKSAGSASLIHALVKAAHRDNYFLALIDGRDSFDPCGLNNTSLRHLLWVRCSEASEAMKAADLLLRDGNFPLVIVDLVLNAAEELRKIPQTNWYRLQRLVELAPTACLVFTPCQMVGSAQLKLVLESSWNLENLEHDPISQLRVRVQRSRFRAEVGSQRAKVS
jgi:hypothetical protein